MNIAVYCSARTGIAPECVADAQALGTWIGRNGHTLVYGGLAYSLMDTVATATAAAGGKVIGVVPESRTDRQHPANTVNILVPDLHERKQTMEENADCFVALDGGIGTLDEVFSCLASASFFGNPKPVHLLNRNGLYEPLRTLLAEMTARSLVTPSSLTHLHFHPDLPSLIAALQP